MLNDLETLGYVEGDCDDIATFVSAIVKRIGYDSRLHAMKSSFDGEYDHVFSEARIGEFWIPIDPTVELGTTYRIFGSLLEYV